jgi:hypothetical protein
LHYIDVQCAKKDNRANHCSSGSGNEDRTSGKVFYIFGSWMIAIRDHVNGGFNCSVHHFGKQNT